MRIEEYQVVESIGSETTSDVYLALEDRLDRAVVLKTCPGAIGQERLLMEARLLARIDSSHVERLFRLLRHHDRDFLVKQYAGPSTLYDLLAAGPLPERDACRLLGQVARGVADAHGVGVLHMDVKPANIVLDGAWRATLIDFGIGAFEGRVRPDVVAGTIPYMAPEQFRPGESTPAADVYSLGTVIYEALAGRRPYPLQPASEWGRDPGPPPPLDVRRGLWRLLETTLDPRPARRPTARALAGQLADLTRRGSAGEELTRRLIGWWHRKRLRGSAATVAASP